ncbi:MAG: Divalent-cation tolerance protein CutA [Candidatus Aminicenantes bacterium ADurb.Bin508]|nr:MAG: Divalent-cation tolerance protein CutA [Candidatus Aminicenantes bacterium ADurb.Bin508]HNX41284.1 divalent-cation tolerance protein CutA [Candidatus Aminicenantes bacterium]HPS99507.1 divalent-cation tolerance protein CutA [Candidatus Aminicenantes bacterium]
MKVVLGMVTVPSREVGERLSSLLVERGLAACVSLLPSLVSTYRWRGKVEREEELLLLIKTRGERVEELRLALKENHPYEVPEMLFFDAHSVFPPYLEWVAANTGGNNE